MTDRGGGGEGRERDVKMSFGGYGRCSSGGVGVCVGGVGGSSRRARARS